MNGTQGTNDSDGVQPVDTGNAERASERRERVDAVCDAWLALEGAAQGDLDLTRAQEKLAQWLSREARFAEGRPIR